MIAMINPTTKIVRTVMNAMVAPFNLPSGVFWNSCVPTSRPIGSTSYLLHQNASVAIPYTFGTCVNVLDIIGLIDSFSKKTSFYSTPEELKNTLSALDTLQSRKASRNTLFRVRS